MKNKGLLQLGVTIVTDEAPLPPYMIRRGAVYFYRRAVPPPLRPYFLTANGKQRTEFVFSLGTKELGTAKELNEIRAIEVTALFKAAQERLHSGIPPSALKTERERLIRWEEARAAYDQENQRLFDEAESEAEVAAELEDIEDQTLAVKYARPLEELTYEERITRRNLRPTIFDSPEVAAARLRQKETDYERAGVEASVRFEKLISGQPQAQDYPRLTTIVGDYSAARGHTLKTAGDWQRIVEHLTRFLGHDNAQAVTSSDLRRWRNFLQNEPLKSGTPRSAKTIADKFLAAVKGTFSYAVDEELIESNPAAQLTLKSKPHSKASKKRDFTLEEIKTILSAATPALSNPAYSKLTDEMKNARRWIPWILAYTGARVNEITQLRECDIKQLDGHWVLHITPEAGTTKTQKDRIVPLHPHLIEQGVTCLAGKGSPSPIFYNSAKARGGSKGRSQNTKVGEYLATWIRRLGINDPNVSPNHGWRHTFRTRATDNELEEAAIDTILGHAPASEGRKYGRMTIQRLAREMEKLPKLEI